MRKSGLFFDGYTQLFGNFVQLHAGLLRLGDQRFDLLGLGFAGSTFFRGQKVVLACLQFADLFVDGIDFCVQLGSSFRFFGFDLLNRLIQLRNLLIQVSGNLLRFAAYTFLFRHGIQLLTIL